MSQQPDLTSTQPVSGGSTSWTGPVTIDLTGKTLGDYEVDRLLGRGGMGEVYLARQISLDRQVAFKVLRADLLTNPISLSRFEAEAGAAAKINHPNIVHIYQLGTIQGLRYIAMEYVAGTNLRDYIVRKGGLELAPALSIMRQAAMAVGAAGEIGLVHRDIKPENILLTRKGQAKVADFGLCRSLNAESVKLTQHGVALGTPMYMSPEQVQGREVDHRSDLYSLGVTFFYMLAGEAPFHGDNPIAVALKHVHERPPNLLDIRPDLPVDVVAMIQKLMAKDPAKRYSSAGELLKELTRLRSLYASGALTQSMTAEPVPFDVPTLPESKPRGAAATPPTAPQTLATTPAQPSVPEAATDQDQDQGTAPRVFWTRPRFAALLVLAAILGGLWGWKGRAPDLLAAGSPGPNGPPGLWLEPAWTDVPRQATPAAQYRHAQFAARRAELVAAWLAVPGHFPGATDWSFRAYVQVAREFFRGHDSARLRALAEDLNRSESRRDAQLARVAHAATLPAGADEDFLADFFDINPAAMDPGVRELALEVLGQRRQANPDGPAAKRMLALQTELLTALQIERLEPIVPARSR